MFSHNRKIADKRPWQLIGADVITPGGELLGVIEDVTVDKHTDTIQQVVIGKSAARGEGFLRLSWYDLEYSEDDQAYVAPPQRRVAAHREARVERYFA